MTLFHAGLRSRAQQLRAAETLWSILVDALTEDVRTAHPWIREIDWRVPTAASLYAVVPQHLPEETARRVWEAWVDYLGARRLPEVESDGGDRLLRASVSRYGHHLVSVTVDARLPAGSGTQERADDQAGLVIGGPG